jgi:hypothetical protein
MLSGWRSALNLLEWRSGLLLYLLDQFFSGVPGLVAVDGVRLPVRNYCGEKLQLFASILATLLSVYCDLVLNLALAPS